MRGKSVILMLVAAVALAPMAWTQDTVESIEKAVIEKFDKITSLSATLAGVADVKINPQSPAAMHLTGDGTLDYLKKEDKPLSRAELNAYVAPPAKLARGLAVYDGKDAWVEWEFFGKIESKKFDQSSLGTVPAGGKPLFDLLKENFNLTALPAEKVGDKDAYVVEGTLKQASSDVPISKLQLSFSKDTGVVLKLVAFSKDNTPMVTLTANDVKLNQPISEDRFKYTPPPPPAPKPPPAAPAAAPTAPSPAPAPTPPAAVKK